MQTRSLILGSESRLSLLRVFTVYYEVTTVFAWFGTLIKGIRQKGVERSWLDIQHQGDIK